MSIKAIETAFGNAQKALREFIEERENLERLSALTDVLVELFDKGKKVLICGNGGSHCDALHFAEEFTGRYRKDRDALPVLALGEASHVTCVGNDYGFDEIFSRGVQAFGQSGDLLIGISTSGNSKNVLKAIEMAKSKGMKTVALLGKSGGEIRGKTDFEWIMPGETSDRIQEIHMCLLHILIEAVERQVFPDHYR